MDEAKRLRRKLAREGWGEELRAGVLTYSMAQQAAGRSKSEVARELGLKPNTLHRWHQLARGERGDVAPKFVELPAATISTESATERKPAVFELEMRSGVKVRLREGFSEVGLRMVLRALEGPC